MAKRIYRVVSVCGALVTDPYAEPPLSFKLHDSMKMLYES